MGDIKINWRTDRKPMQVDIQELLYESVELREGNGSQYQEMAGRLFKASYAKGSFPVYIIASSTSDIHVGHDLSVYLQVATDSEIRDFFTPVGREERKVLAKMLQQQDMGTGNQNAADQLNRIIQLHNEHPVFYIPTLPIPKEDLISRDDISELIDAALTDGLDKDKHIIYCAKILLPTVLGDKRSIAPEEVMYANPHMMVITNTKTGKTSTFGKLGYLEERPTPANLLGFSTAKESIKGSIHQRTKPTIADGVEESAENEEAARGLLNCMERGRTRVSRGKGVEVETYTTFVFTSNPISDHKEITPKGKSIESLEQFLRMIHRNTGAIGSRIAIFLFDTEMQSVRKTGQYGRNVQRELSKFLRTVQELLKVPFTAFLLHPRIDEWIRKEDEKMQTYKKNLQDIASVLSHFPTIQRFAKGNIDACSHIRGAAIRAAFMDFVREIIQIEKMSEISDTLVEELLKKANFHLDMILQINLDSFNKLIGVVSNKDLMEKWVNLRFENFNARATVYEKMLMRCVIAWFMSQEKDNMKWEVILSALKEYYLTIPLSERQKSPYGSFNALCSAIEKNLDKINGKREMLGFTLIKRNGVILIKISPNHHWIARMAVHYGLIESLEKYQFYQFYQSDDKKIGNIGNIGDENNPIEDWEF